MRKLLFILLSPFCFKAQNDSLNTTHFNISAGISISNYFDKGFNTSSQPLGYRFGVGVTKDLKNNFEAGVNIWYQNSQFNNVTTNSYDSFYQAHVSLLTNIQFQQLYISGELSKKYKKFYFGINAGINYLLTSQTTQDVSSDVSGSSAINIHNFYSIKGYEGESIYNVINPFAGISISYFPIPWLGVKYQNNMDMFSSPQQGYQFFKKINPFLNCLTLTIKIK
jgi:hypothetical protein